MVYESQISFTLDTICGWSVASMTDFGPGMLTPMMQDILGETEDGDRGKCLALEKFRASPAAQDVNFTVKYFPYQLYPDASKEGEDEWEWYRNLRFNGSEEQMKRYTALLSAHGVGVGLDYNFHGTVANSMDAHRMIQHYQEEMGPEVAGKILDSLYYQYFTEEKHPSAPDTLLKAAESAGIDRSKAEAFIGDEYEALPETKMLIREQVTNGVDTVPHIVIEGKRRDFTLEGAKEVDEYVKEFERVAKESK